MTHKGKSEGLRTIIAYRQEHRLVFIFGFAKRETANIDQTQRRALLELGNVYMAMSEKDLAEAIETGTLIEIVCHDKEKEPTPQ